MHDAMNDFIQLLPLVPPDIAYGGVNAVVLAVYCEMYVGGCVWDGWNIVFE